MFNLEYVRHKTTLVLRIFGKKELINWFDPPIWDLLNVEKRINEKEKKKSKREPGVLAS